MDSVNTWMIALGLIQGGAVGLLGWAVRQVLTGRLVPRAAVDDWKEAHRISEQGRAEQAQQIGELLQLARTTDKAITSIAERGGRAR